MKRLLLIAALAATATPVIAADGFSYNDLNAAARGARPSATVAASREQVAQTETVRAAFVLDPARAWKALSKDESRVLYDAFGGQRPLGDEAVQWFMRGASSGTSGGTGGRDITGLYNPVADVWLVLRWQTVGGAPRIIDAAFVPGLLLRDGDDGSAWTDKPEVFADALAQGAASAKAGFSNLNGDAFFEKVAPMAALAREQAFGAIMTWMVSLRPWGEDKGRMAQWRSLHDDLASGKAGGVVASLPPATRASLIPMGAVTHDGGQALLLMSPLAPQVVVTADYGRKGKPEVSLINLANARPVTLETQTQNAGASQ